MAVIRPEVTEAIWRLREVIWAGLVVAAGLWLVSLGGWLLVPAGAILAAVGAVLAVTAWRRARFEQAEGSPGVVELDEAQVAYLGPGTGGFLSLQELVELRLLTLRGRRLWRLKQADGQALLIPVDAKGSERLFDAFANLPGMDSAALVAALSPAGRPGAAAGSGAAAGAGSGPGRGIGPAGDTRVIWRRSGSGLMRSQ